MNSRDLVFKTMSILNFLVLGTVILLVIVNKCNIDTYEQDQLNFFLKAYSFPVILFITFIILLFDWLYK
jgi:hypothetical protein